MDFPIRNCIVLLSGQRSTDPAIRPGSWSTCYRPPRRPGLHLLHASPKQHRSENAQNTYCGGGGPSREPISRKRQYQQAHRLDPAVHDRCYPTGKARWGYVWSGVLYDAPSGARANPVRNIVGKSDRTIDSATISQPVPTNDKATRLLGVGLPANTPVRSDMRIVTTTLDSEARRRQRADRQPGVIISDLSGDP